MIPISIPVRRAYIFQLPLKFCGTQYKQAKIDLNIVKMFQLLVIMSPRPFTLGPTSPMKIPTLDPPASKTRLRPDGTHGTEAFPCVAWWLSGRALDMRLTGRRFNSRLFRSHITLINSALHPSGSLNRIPASAGGKGGNPTFAGWQVTLCDPIWHVSFP